MILIATARDDIAGFVETLALVYTILIIAYIFSQLFFSFGGRVPYSRTSSAVMGFLHDVAEPYLRIFRRFIPPIGPLDLSPVVAIFVLNIAATIVAGLIRA